MINTKLINPHDIIIITAIAVMAHMILWPAYKSVSGKIMSTNDD